MVTRYFIFAGALAGLFIGISLPGLAQNFYFQTPVPLSDTINSRAEESYPIFSEKDSTLYFVRTLYSANIGGTRSGQDIWYSQRQPDGSWTLPQNNLDELNNRGNNAVVGVSKTGNTLYLLNSYENASANQPGLAFSFHQSTGWLEPTDVEMPMLADNQGNHYGIYVTAAEDVAVLSMAQPGAVGQEDLYVTFKDAFSGNWSRPVHLGDTVNSEGYEMSPFLSEDQRHLFFASNGHPGYGNADLFVSTRLDSSWTNWSEPKNLGDGINSAGFDAYLSITSDNDAFFVSNRYGRSADIYYSKLITQEERDQELASRIEAAERRPLDSLSQGQSVAPGDIDAETQALLAETEALLSEFRGEKGQQPTPTNPGNTPETATADSDTQFLFFALNSSELRTSATPYLRDIAAQLKRNPTTNVELVGHADDTGGKDYNLKLSIERAQRAKQFLTSQGIEEARIVAYGRGSTKPLGIGDDPETRRKNRRVEIRLDR